MKIVVLTESWPSSEGPPLASHETSVEVATAWRQRAPHADIQAFGIGDGGARSIDVLEGNRSRVGGVEVTDVGGTKVLGAPQRRTRWEPHALASALLGLAAEHAHENQGERSGRQLRVVVPVGDEAVAGDPTDVWLGGPEAMRQGLTPLDIVVAVSSQRPLLGFNGMSASVRDGRENDTSLALAAQVQEQRWADIARRGDAIAQVTTLMGPTRLSDVPGSGAAGGLAYCLSVAGGRLQPAATVLAQLNGAEDAAAQADLVVAVVSRLEPRTLDEGVIPTASAFAGTRGVPAIVIAPDTRIGRRDLMNAGISSAHQGAIGAVGLRDAVARVAQTWTPQR